MLKDIRLAIMDTLKRELDGVKTYFTGYPFYISVQYAPFVAVYTESATVSWKGQLAYDKTYTLSIVIGINAQQEIEQRNRGIEDEAWLNDKVDEIIDILFSKLYRIGQATLQSNISVDYRDGGGNIRYATITVAYNEVQRFTI
jgi:hypothetical protein